MCILACLYSATELARQATARHNSKVLIKGQSAYITKGKDYCEVCILACLYSATELVRQATGRHNSKDAISVQVQLYRAGWLRLGITLWGRDTTCVCV